MTGTEFTHARILIVDDQPPNVAMLERLLRHAGYRELRSTSDPRQVFELYAAFHPDLILLDIHMPYLDGYEVMEQLTPELDREHYLPVLVLSGDLSPKARQRALAVGAKDFLNKPFEATEVLLRIRNLLETRFLYVQLQTQNETLEVKVRERTQDLEHAQIEILERLAMAAEFRDDATRQHVRRVGLLSVRIATVLGLPAAEVERIGLAAPLHDVGKIAIPDRLLLKLDRLTREEFEIMKTHTVVGARLLSGSHFAVLRLAEQIALTHHERWDGNGYSVGLRREEIPLVGRIVAVADVFDALTHERPYKRAWPLAEAIAEIEGQRGRQFDPDVVEAFRLLVDRRELAGDAEELDLAIGAPPEPRLANPGL